MSNDPFLLSGKMIDFLKDIGVLALSIIKLPVKIFVSSFMKFKLYPVQTRFLVIFYFFRTIFYLLNVLSLSRLTSSTKNILLRNALHSVQLLVVAIKFILHPYSQFCFVIHLTPANGIPLL